MDISCRFRRFRHRVDQGQITCERRADFYFDVVYVTNFPGTTNSFTVPDALSSGLSLILGNNYNLEIGESGRGIQLAAVE